MAPSNQSERKYRSKHSDPDYKGEPSDRELVNGPLEQRGCTDILCLLIFIACCVGMVIVSVIAFKNGHPNLLVNPYDSDGNQCGTGNLSDYKYLYFAIPFSGYTANTVCVKSCPSYQNSSDYPTKLDCSPNSVVKSCVGVASSESQLQSSINSINAGNTSPVNGTLYIYNSTGFVGRYCVPTLDYFSQLPAVGHLTAAGTIEKWISDVKFAWTIILAALGISFVLGLLYLVFIRFCVGILVWITILGLIGGCGGFGYYLFHRAGYLDSQNSSTTTQGESSNVSTTTITTLKVFAYILWAIGAIILLAVCCLFNRIRLTIGILKTAAAYVGSTWTSLLVPIVMMILLAGIYVYWIFTAVYLASWGTVTHKKGTPYGTIEVDANAKRLLVFHVFGGLWLNAFVIALTQLILACSVSLWYFNVAYERAHSTVGKGVNRSLRYHLGSVAFGSLILAIMKLIRIIWNFFQKRLKSCESATGGCLVKCCVCYISCCLSCFERYLKFLTKNAYIQIALEGKGFLTSAVKAFYLMLRNGMMFVLVGGLGELFISVGKYLIAVVTAGVGYIILTRFEYYNSKIYSALIPAFVIFCLGWAVGSLFLSVYGVAADTILQCYILTRDLMQNHGVYIKPPGPMQDFVDNHDELKQNEIGRR